MTALRGIGFFAAFLVFTGGAHAKPTVRENESGFRVEYRGLGMPLRLMGGPIRDASIGAIFAVGDHHSPLAQVVALSGTFGGGGPVLAQAGPVAPWNRGCGLLQVQIPAIDANLQQLDRHPQRREARGAMESGAFANLADAVRVPFEQEWVRLESIFGRLTLLAADLVGGLSNALRRVDQMEVQACNLKRDSDRVLPLLAQWNSTCRGTVPDSTYRWCIAQKARLQPDVDSLQNGDAALRQSVGDFEANFSRPIRDMNDAARALYADWNSRLNEHLRRLKAALANQNAACQNRVNIHIQANGFDEHQPYHDNREFPMSGSTDGSALSMTNHGL